MYWERMRNVWTRRNSTKWNRAQGCLMLWIAMNSSAPQKMYLKSIPIVCLVAELPCDASERVSLQSIPWPLTRCTRRVPLVASHASGSIRARTGTRTRTRACKYKYKYKCKQGSIGGGGARTSNQARRVARVWPRRRCCYRIRIQQHAHLDAAHAHRCSSGFTFTHITFITSLMFRFHSLPIPQSPCVAWRARAREDIFFKGRRGKLPFRTANKGNTKRKY